LDCRAWQFAEAAGDEIETGTTERFFSCARFAAKKSAVRTRGQNELFFGREWKRLAKARHATKRLEEYSRHVHRLTPNPKARPRSAAHVTTASGLGIKFDQRAVAHWPLNALSLLRPIAKDVD
jgi:hypothetical protein